MVPWEPGLSRREFLSWAGAGLALAWAGLLPEAEALVARDPGGAVAPLPPVLISDDDHGVRALCRLILETWGMNVLDTGDALEVLQLCATQPVALVLSDVMQPRMDGFTLLKQLRANPATRHVPLVFVTARCDLGSMAEGLALGAADYITKPFIPHEYAARIRAVLVKQGIHYPDLYALTAERPILTLDERRWIPPFGAAPRRQLEELYTPDAGEAWHILRSTPVSLLIADISRGGLALLQRVRANAPTAALPVILTTAQPALASLSEAVRLHAHGYIVKPPPPLALRTTAARLLAQGGAPLSWEQPQVQQLIQQIATGKAPI